MKYQERYVVLGRNMKYQNRYVGLGRNIKYQDRYVVLGRNMKYQDRYEDPQRLAISGIRMLMWGVRGRKIV